MISELNLNNDAKSATGCMWKQKKINEELFWMLCNTYDIPHFVARFLSARTDITEENFTHFIDPKIKSLMPNPMSLLDMEFGTSHIIHAIRNKKRIAVFADYDVDGATSAALLVRFFRAIDIKIELYVPDRVIEGYGPNTDALIQLKSSGIDVVITVDCGIVAFEPLAAAANAGLDIIVIDHHIGVQEKPTSIAVIDPNRYDETSDLTYLCGVGVCFMFCSAMIIQIEKHLPNINTSKLREVLMSLLDLVALGTICDVVPLLGLNRAFVTTGLKMINKMQNCGISQMTKLSNTSGKISAYHLGFVYGPMINAGGRIGKSTMGARLLSTNDEIEAISIAQELLVLNKKRAEIEQVAVADIIQKIGTEEHPESIIFEYSPDWHQGVIGIVASRIKDIHNKPTIIGSEIKDEDGNITIKASCRSIHGVNFGHAINLAVQHGLLIKGGGHAMAAGFTVSAAKVGDFMKFMNSQLQESITSNIKNRFIEIDNILTIQALHELPQYLEMLQPFGPGNNAPTVILKDIIVIKIQEIKEIHMRVTLKCKHSSEYIFGMIFKGKNTTLGNAMYANIKNTVNLACTTHLKEYLGKTSVDLIIVDMCNI